MRVFLAAALLATSCIVAMGADAAHSERLEVDFDARQRRVNITVSNLTENQYELRLETPGLSELETGDDVNEPGIIYLPPREGPISLEEKPVATSPAENIFFFNDLADAPQWILAVHYNPSARGTWKLNGRFSDAGGNLAPVITLPVLALEHGENLLHIRSDTLQVPRMYFRQRVPEGRQFTTSFDVGHSNWTGTVSLMRLAPAREAMLVRRASLAGVESERREIAVQERWWLRRDDIVGSAISVGRNILNAQVTNPRSMFHNGFNLVYDQERKSYRMPHWLWAWGPSIALLLDLEKLPESRPSGMAQRFRDAALAAGKRSLEFGMNEPKHPARGVSTVRWEPSRAVPNGWVEYISTADSLFLAGWGWMSLYNLTNDPVFLDRTKLLVAAAERLMKQYPVIPQDWVVQRDRWTPHTLDESVFGMVGFRELHAATQSSAVADGGRRFLDSHLEHMGRESGLLERAWMREEDRAIWDPDIKGHAWVIEGYLDAHRLSGDIKYLELARMLAERVMDCQHEDGSWAILFKKPGPDDPRDDKGTAIWAYMFYLTYRETGDERHLAAARRAAGWCLRHQYRGEDPHLDGGILNTNSMAYVQRRAMTILYSTTFFGLALLEELKLAREN